MSCGIEHGAAEVGIYPDTPVMAKPIVHALLLINKVVVVLGMLALLLASLVLTYCVISQYVIKVSTDWQDEAAVFVSWAQRFCWVLSSSHSGGMSGSMQLPDCFPRQSINFAC